MDISSIIRTHYSLLHIYQYLLYIINESDLGHVSVDEGIVFPLFPPNSTTALLYLSPPSFTHLGLPTFSLPPPALFRSMFRSMLRIKGSAGNLMTEMIEGVDSASCSSLGYAVMDLRFRVDCLVTCYCCLLLFVN
ncbi:hypothetical protein HanRHA438_Chr05g0208581 [Helianthus annuus]|nr:hypothetical protein HanRHA438_Chr05g0208581 [Helianthus annuus]